MPLSFYLCTSAFLRSVGPGAHHEQENENALRCSQAGGEYLPAGTGGVYRPKGERKKRRATGATISSVRRKRLLQPSSTLPRNSPRSRAFTRFARPCPKSSSAWTADSTSSNQSARNWNWSAPAGGVLSRPMSAANHKAVVVENTVETEESWFFPIRGNQALGNMLPFLGHSSILGLFEVIPKTELMSANSFSWKNSPTGSDTTSTRSCWSSRISITSSS